MKGRITRGLMVALLMVGALAACGDDDEDGTAPATTGEGSSANALDIEMIDHAYKLKGELRPGLATITSRNTGQEFHMAGLGKLKPGKTVAELTKALEAQGEGGGEEGGGEGGNPLAEFFEKELGTPGHILQPGQSQSLTVDVLDEGTYVMLCFIPTEGEGTPHLAKGMVGSFEVKGERSTAKAPEADATITLGDEAEPTGVPTDLAAGQHTFKVTASGSKGKDFGIGSVEEGKDFKAFDEFFETEFEKKGGPEKGAAKRAPGSLYGFSFEIEPGDTIYLTVDIPSGETFFVGSTNSENEQDDPVDKVVTVKVT